MGDVEEMLDAGARAAIGEDRGGDRQDRGGDRQDRGGDRQDRGGDRQDRGGERPASRHRELDNEHLGRRPPRSPSPDPQEREREEALRADLTVLVQRIHPRADDFEIFEFFSQAGKVRDIRLIRDQRSNKSKGVGYVEFCDAPSVLNALALNGIAFKGQSLLVQASMAERNRLAQANKNVAAAASMMGGTAPSEPTKLTVSELHANLTQADVSQVFSPFGELVEITMPTDPNSGAALGVAHLTFRKPEEAKAAQEAIHGLELVGKRINVTLVPAASAAALAAPSMPPGAFPNMLPNMMVGGGAPMGSGFMAAVGGGSAVADPPSTCVLLTNMFDPDGHDEKTDPNFFDDLCEDVADEVGKHGEVLSSAPIPMSAGHLYLRFSSESGAAQCVAALNGRWFAGKQVQANTVDEAQWPKTS